MMAFPMAKAKKLTRTAQLTKANIGMVSVMEEVRSFSRTMLALSSATLLMASLRETASSNLRMRKRFTRESLSRASAKAMANSSSRTETPMKAISLMVSQMDRASSLTLLEISMRVQLKIAVAKARVSLL